MYRLILAGAFFVLGGFASSLHAAVLALAPDNEIVEVSSSVTVSIQVSELSGAQVGAFDLTVSWDPAVLSLQNPTLGTELDGPDKSFHTSIASPGNVNLAEFSFDDLSDQSEPVLLATLSFVAVGAGNANLSAVGNIAGAAVLLGDAVGAPLSADISVTDVKVNGPPTAQAQLVFTDEDMQVAITLGGSDPNGDDLEFAVTDSPTIGTLSGTPPNLTYTPNTNENGSDSFAFTVSDGRLTSEPAIVDITVNAVNDPPLVTNDETSTLEDTAVTVSVLDNDSDVESSPLVVAAVSGGALGVASTDGTTVTYVPGADLNGVDVVTYTVSDGEASSSGSLTVTIIPVNDAPVAVDDAFTTNEDQTLTVAAPGVLANDSDVDGDSLSATIVENPAHGSLQLETDGSFTYAPASDFFGTDGFTYRIDDGHEGFATAAVTLTVNPVNDEPSVSVDLATQTVQYSDGIAAVTVTATDIDSTLTGTALTSDGVISDLSVSAGTCAPAELGPAGVTGVGSQCTWLLTGNVTVAAGSYSIGFSVSDGSLADSASTSVLVEVEDAEARLSDDNTLSVGVDSPGSDSSLLFTLAAVVSELQPDQAANQAAPGDVSLADVEMLLVPVGPGGSVAPQSCTSEVTGAGYDALKTVACEFDDAPVNTYTVELNVVGSYYVGADESVVTVFDPSLGFTTGGGWFYWPGTENGTYAGDRTNFGYTMKYNKKATKVQGSLLLIRRTPDGAKYRIKSNAIDGLALGEEKTVPFGWASFSGKTTYLEPGWLDPEGNHGFTAYVEDRDEPGNGVDRVWVQTRGKAGDVLPQSSMTEPASDNAAEIQGGNIVVPHGGGR